MKNFFKRWKWAFIEFIVALIAYPFISLVIDNKFGTPYIVGWIIAIMACVAMGINRDIKRHEIC